MADFNPAHKQERGAYFEEGTHKVTISDVEFGFTPPAENYPSGKEFAEIKVEGPNGEEGSSRVWFTTDGAIGYSFNIFKSLFVHNTPEAKRDEIKQTIDALTDTKGLEKISKNLIGGEAWYVVARSDRTYINGQGETKHSYDRNVYGYEPKPKAKTKEEMVNEVMGNSESVKSGESEPFPFS